MRTRLLALPLIVGLAAIVPTTATADDSGADTAVEWLHTQTLDTGLIESFPGWGDYGLTFDSILAAAATNAPRDIIDTWVDGAADGFAEMYVYDDGDGLTWTSGMIGKAVLALDAVGASTTDFGGINVQDLNTQSLTLGAEPGWVGAPGAATDSNAFAQALVMIAAARTGDLPADTVQFLAGKQCDDGGFPMFFTQGKSCSEAGASSDPDGTAMLVMALRSAQADGIAAADAPLNEAVDWLVGMQRENGSYFGAVPWTAVENTNSTGLVAASLAGIEDDVVAKAADWVRSLQTDSGAIAYDASSFAQGLTETNVSVFVRSTPQAALALAGVSYHDVHWREETPEPNEEPSEEPSAAPSTEPTVTPTAAPTVKPTTQPTVELTVRPTVSPTLAPAPRPGLPKTGH